MVRFIIKRLVQAVFVLFFASIFVFTTMHFAPGDPAMMKIGPGVFEQGITEKEYLELYNKVREQMGLDKPLFVQYFIWLKDVMRGDFGYSLRNEKPVVDLIGEKLPASLQLMLMSILLSLLISIPLSIIQAVKYKTKLDNALFTLNVALISVPPFWLGLMLILLFSVKLGWLPSGGYYPFFKDPLNFLKTAILPTLTVSFVQTAINARYLRADLAVVLTEDYIKMAVAKGLSNFRVVVGHALRNSLVSFLTVVGMSVGLLLGGQVIIEQVFQWPGIGWLLFNAISNRDYAVVQGVFLLLCFVIVIMNLIVDVTYYFLNPKMREEFIKTN